jgi:AbrB family looped-hinge helix DNA binding protein
MIVSTAEMYAKGQITIPKVIRDNNGLREGAKLSVVDLGDGCLLVEPMEGDVVKQINRSFDRTSELLRRNGASLESALAEIRRLRESGE